MNLQKWIENNREKIIFVLLIVLFIFLCGHYILNRQINQSEDKLESFRTGGSSTCGNSN